MNNFCPKSFLDLAFAMKTRATCNIEGTSGVIVAITRHAESQSCWTVTLLNGKDFIPVIFCDKSDD